MNNSYNLHSWSKHCREEAPSEARIRHIAERARAGHAACGASGYLEECADATGSQNVARRM